jgi:glucan phosphoethanolaminetransferase (alkaline phosphatase superfamily)
MSPKEIVLANTGVTMLQLWVIALSIFLSFSVSLIFIIWFQNRKDIIAEKHRLLISLMSERKEIVVSHKLAK